MTGPGGPDQFHGGDDSVATRWPNAPKPILDLSTGINPFSYPVERLAKLVWLRLPQREAENQLKHALAGYLGLTGTDTLALAPGSQILINQLPFLFDRGPVFVSQPTYSEHMSCWARAGHQVIVVEGWDEPHDEGTFFVVTNPNNPDGRQIDRNRLIDIARSRGCYLVVDEAFADLAPDISVVDLVQELPVIVLRSFGKFFGHAGVRLGVMVAAPDLCSRMRDRLGPWCVSGPALAIASKAYSDKQWIANTRARLKVAAAQLDRLLVELGLDLIGGTDLFRLVAHPRASAIYEGLGGRGILVRPFEDHPSWLRFGLPCDEAAQQRLVSALKETLCDVQDRH